MLNFIKQKMKNKFWLTLCLVFGMAVLVASFACVPMFKRGSEDKLINQLFTDEIEATSKYSAVIGRSGSFSYEKRKDVKSVNKGIKKHTDNWKKYFSDLDIIYEQSILQVMDIKGYGEYIGKKVYTNAIFMPEIEEHIKILTGTKIAEYKGDCIPCYISERSMDETGITLNEKIDILSLSGDVIGQFQVVGVIKESQSSDLFWRVGINDLERGIFIDEASFNKILKLEKPENTYYTVHQLIDYNNITSKNIGDVSDNLNAFVSSDEKFEQNILPLVEQYNKQKKSIVLTLWVLELPILGMVIAFIYMVSKQIIDSEKHEIATMRSRGFSKLQIVFMYAVQAFLMGIAGIIIGLPIGYMLCKIGAGTTDFLTFSGKSLALYKANLSMVGYGSVAALIGMVFIIIPAIKYSGLSIVQQKADNYAGKKMFWEKYYLDVILLAVSLYLLKNYNDSIDKVREKALEGSKMDPLIFLDSTLFIVAFGLLVLRLTNYLVKFVYKTRKNKWKPSAYVSFLQIVRGFSKQGFISVFLVLTVAIGLFNANAARTLNQNKEDRIVYENAADLSYEEKWDVMVSVDGKGNPDYTYIEPDFGKYDELRNENLIKSYARVIYANNATCISTKQTQTDCQFMAINTVDFGTTACLKETLYGDKHWYEYLNALADDEYGVIISSNLAKKLKVKVGDAITIDRKSERSGFANKQLGRVRCNVSAVVDCWPGYNAYKTDDEGNVVDNYLCVMNYATAQVKYQISPYKVIMSLEDGVNGYDVVSKLEEYGKETVYYGSCDEKIWTMKNSSSIQITNGMFTLGFIIALILCGVGFLIYWISSIKQRELLFGVYRAMGMSVKDENRMLIYEHIFSTLLSVLAGSIVGMTTTLLFSKLFAVIYMPEKHNVPIEVCYEPMDTVKLFAIITVVIVSCLLILRKLIKSMNITQALKLGEE